MEFKVAEKFVSINGEGTKAGQPVVFIRLAGCNLRCSYCDSAYAWEGGTAHEVDELVAAAAASGMDCVEITGGEPLIHPETPELAARLIASGMEVLVETNGSLDIGVLPPECRRIMDCKLPGSGMAECNLPGNFPLLTPRDEVKFVVSSYDDFAWALKVIDDWELPRRTPNLIFSPVWGKVKFDELARWVMGARRPIRMQLQLHKLVWGDRRGI